MAKAKEAAKPRIIVVAEDVQNVVRLNPALPGMEGPADGPWTFNAESGVTDEALLAELGANAGEIYYKHPEHGTDPLREDSFAFLIENGFLEEPEVPAEPAVAEKPAKAPKAPKAEKPAKAPKAPKAEKPAKAPKVDEPRYTRDDAVTEAIKEIGPKGFTMDDLLKYSDDIAVAKGLKSNPTATNVNRYMVLALVNFGVLKQDGKKFTLVK